MPELDYSSIAAPFDGDAPTGVNLREDPSRIAHYRAIRDARSAARAEDRSAETRVIDGASRKAEEDVHQPSSRWQEVHDLCFAALATETKDIELLAWLSEAVARTKGLMALADVLDAMGSLVGTHFEALHSVDDETVADRVLPLSGLNGSLDSDGTLIRPLRLMSLAPNRIYGRLSLWEFEQARKSNNGALLADFQQEFSNLDGSEFVAQRQAAETCIAIVQAMDTQLTEICGADAPSFSRVKDVLDDIRNALTELSVHVKLPQPIAAKAENEEGAAVNGAATPTAAVAAPGQIADREQAFRALLEIAAFFRRTEPHSTLPLAIETLVRRGRMDFLGLLGELIPDENQRREILTRAGIQSLKGPDGR